MAFDPEKLKKVKATFDPARLEAVKTQAPEQKEPGFLSKANTAAGHVLKAGVDTISAPFELAGEALRLPMEGKPLNDFRAPTIVQRVMDGSVDAANPPADPFSQVNKGIRAVQGGVKAIGAKDLLKGVVKGTIGEEGKKRFAEGAKAGYSEDRGTMGIVEDVALGLSTGRFSPKVANAPMEILVEGARRAVRLGKKFAGATGKALMSTTLGPSVKNINMRIARNPEIVNAKPFETLANELPDDIQRLSDKVSKMSGEALDQLSSSRYLMDGATAKDTILKAVKTEKTGLGRTISDATAQARKVLDRYAYRLKRLTNTVSEQELGKIIRDIDNDIDWSAKEMAPINRALEGVRVSIDNLLKGQNPAYAAAMEPTAAGTRLLKKAQRIFNIENDIGKGFKPKNATASNLKSAVKENNIDSRETLEGIRKITGRDYLREAENAAVAEAFQGGKSAGSRRVNLGGIIGGAAGYGMGGVHGGMTGTLAGGLTGAYIDKQGGQIAGTLIDKLLKIPRVSAPPGLRKVLDASYAITAGRGDRR